MQNQSGGEDKGPLGGVVGSIQHNLPDISLIKLSIGEVSYPAQKTDLIAAAENKGASSEVLDALRAIPEQVYQSVEEVTSAVEEGTKENK